MRMASAFKFLFFACGFATAASAAAYVLTLAGATFYPVLLLFPLLVVAWPLILWHWRRLPLKMSTSALVGGLPRWAKAAAILAFVLATANFLLCGWLNEFGRPVRIGDSYALKAGATELRSLTADEYQRARAIEMRLITGHLILLFAFTSYFARATWVHAAVSPTAARPR